MLHSELFLVLGSSPLRPVGRPTKPRRMRGFFQT